MDRDEVRCPADPVEIGSRSAGESDASKRGQTTLDFAIGMSVFMAVVLFIFLFVPGILEPFTAGAQDETVTTNRVADDLTKGTLGNATEPNVLETRCVVVFFDGYGTDACGFGGDDLNEYLGIKARQHVNVSINGNVTTADDRTELLCWDVDDGLVERDGEGAGDGDCTHGGDDVLLAAGGVPPTNNDEAVTATRVAWVDGRDVTVSVVMW